MCDERGQATIEWTTTVVLVALALAGLGRVAPAADGRSLGGFLAHALACAARGGCRDGDDRLARVYGARDAELVRANAPNLVYERGERSLPVDYRRCRSRRCSDAPDDPYLDAHTSTAGSRATAFTRVVHRRGRTYVVYWLYYPDSNTTWAGSDRLWRHSPLRLLGRYPGFHPDDWEAYEVRIDPDGSTWARASAHGHWQGCIAGECKDRWMRSTSWTRVSRGSHAGHIPLRRRPAPGGPLLGPPSHRWTPLYPGPDVHERSTTSEGLVLVPLETLDRRGYRPLPAGVGPPWGKEAYRDPTTDES